MRLRWLACALLVLGVACEDEPPVDDPGAGSGGFLGGLFGGGTTGGGAAAGGGGWISGGDAGGGTQGGSLLGGIFGGGAEGGVVGGGVQGGGVQGGGVQGGGTAGGGTSTGLPCDVNAILVAKCQTCHGNPLMSGPMPLITWNDLQATSPVYAGVKIAERVKARIRNTASPMPPAARPQLTAQELATLESYLNAGAPQSTVTCGGGGTTGGGTTGAGGGTTGGSGFGVYVPPDSECTYIQEFRAHAGQTANDNTPFEPPQGSDRYEMFYFVPKWREKVHTIRVDPIIDNGAVLHHWLLYMEDGVGSGDGTHVQDIGLQSATAELLSGWAPGNENLGLGREVGLKTIAGPNARFGIEIHYNTTGNPANRRDRSGARICVTKNLRPREASTHWLGTQAILNLGFVEQYSAQGVCTVYNESHIIAMSPHMHINGRYMKTTVQHANGGTSTITDKPFSFDDQQIYPIKTPTGEIVVRSGDVITTTCTYDGLLPFVFGPNTDMEMCYNFVVAWPAGSLSNGLPGLVGGQNTCIDGIL
jgi:Copper type II ascorbate-dependent monooxygenase, C-terminal domain